MFLQVLLLATRCILFNKPRSTITTNSDELGRTTAIQSLYDSPNFPLELINELDAVGRLDKNTSGLLLFTNSGDLIHHVTSTRSIPKTYRARIMGVPSLQLVDKMRAGVDLKGGLGMSAPCIVEPDIQHLLDESSSTSAGSTWLTITITEGKNRQIRRMCHEIGHGCIDLKRIAIGGLNLSTVENEGDFRELTMNEISQKLHFNPPF